MLAVLVFFFFWWGGGDIRALFGLDLKLEKFISKKLFSESRSFSSNQVFFSAAWATQGEMCMLKSFSQLVMCTNVKDRYPF